MAIIENATLYFAKLDPLRPSAKFTPDNPRWELQLRCTDKATRSAWKELGLDPKLVEDDETDTSYYRVNVNRPTISAKGKANSPVSVEDMEGNPIDPTTIGNGSIGNVMVFQYPVDKKNDKGVVIGKATVSQLKKIQLVKHVVYKYEPKDDETFEKKGKTTVVVPDEHDSEDFGPATKTTPKVPKTPPASADSEY